MSSAAFQKFDNLLEFAQNERDRLQAKLDTINKNKEDIAEAMRLCSLCMEDSAKLKVFVEDIVTEIISATFQGNKYEDYEFKLETQYAADKVTVTGWQIVVVMPDGTVIDPGESEGEGLVTTISVGLKLALLVLNPELTNVVLLDEALKELATDRQQRFVNIMQELHKVIPIQFFAVSHEYIKANRNYLVTMTDGVSIVK